MNQKYIANLLAFIVFVFISGFHAELGIEHNLLVYGSDPGWSYTDMRGFGPSLGPWLWFKLYWAAWALLLALAATLLWVRGRESGLRSRLRLARRRFTRPTAWVAGVVAGLVLALGGFIFYNTNILNEYATASDEMEQRAEYERRYGQYEGIPQPRLAGTELHVEIYPDRRAVDIRGTYRLVNSSAGALDTIHVAPVPGVESGPMAFDRPAALVLADDVLGHRVYALEEPLQPGDALLLDFEMHIEPRGFRNSGIDTAVVANGSYFTNQAWLPAIGYQPNRELSSAEERRAYGLEPYPPFLSLYDVEARQSSISREQTTFEAVVGTDEDQVAVAPGVPRRMWTEGGRRYFHYSTDTPIGNEYAFFSADYAVYEGQWKDVTIRIFHHPGHTATLERMIRSVQASLSYYTEQFGPYPHRHLTLVEHPGHALGMHAEATLIDYEEGFSLLNPQDEPQGTDLPFSVVAHEVAHQWWGSYLAHARVEGAILLSETLAQYSAYQVVRKNYGQAHLRRLIMNQLRQQEESPRPSAAAPLLQATDSFLAYRKGPLAMYALSVYLGEEQVNEALRRLLAKHASGTLLTSLDLYQALQAVAPDSRQYLLYDLFEANTFWELEMEQATARQSETGRWEVTMEVRARKVVVDAAGVEREVPMDDWVQVGLFAPVEEGEGLEVDRVPYLGMHRLRSGAQTITVTVPHEPAYAGIDPYYLLIDLELGDNIKEVQRER